MKSSDRELLELSAKAAELRLVWVPVAPYPGATEHPKVSGGHWNPLTDDGDALRLAANLEMMVNITPTQTHAYYSKKLVDGMATDTCYRCAIVRAAAEIGRSMP